VCLLSIGGVFLAHVTDGTGLADLVPDITRDSIESLLQIMAAGMLVIATFAVVSMVSAFASASSSATPRSFSLVISDDTSQNALSTFIGAFIFSVVALLALMNGYYGKSGRFTLFALKALAFAIVIITFVRWVDSIARLGRMGNTIDRVESAATDAFRRRRLAPRLGGIAPEPHRTDGRSIYADAVGYLQHLDVPALQERAESIGVRVVVAVLPGAFCTPNRPVAHVIPDPGRTPSSDDIRALVAAFVIGGRRTFGDDPRFGLVVLSEIASRALSPAVNDPGTAIDVIGTLVRLLTLWHALGETAPDGAVSCGRVGVPLLSMDDLFDDAFTGIARDGAGTVEVVVRLQKGLEALAAIGDPTMRASALRHARLALVRAESAMTIAHDLDAVRRALADGARTGRRPAGGERETA
jgi:uncharacterized membrane protein